MSAEEGRTMATEPGGEPFKILEKIFDMIGYAYPALAQFPKSEKFGLVADIKRILDQMLELTIEAQKKYYKKTTLQELDVCVAKLKAYLRRLGAGEDLESVRHGGGNRQDAGRVAENRQSEACLT